MLGLVATGKRSIKSGKEYNSYFEGKPVTGNETELVADADVHDTVKLMKKMVSQSLSDTKDISKKLKGKNLQETCNNIWKFLYHHVQYKKDSDTREQLRTPARTWKDRASGVDCDCYTIFISSVLTNLSIPHMMRMAAYKGDYQHIYVVVPKSGKTIDGRSSYYVIDPVVNSFNYEVPYTKKSDAMPRVTMLNGFGACDETPIIDRIRHFLPTQQVIQKGGVPTLQFLIENRIPYAAAFDRQQHRSVYGVCTPNGLLILPTIMSPAQAEGLKNAMSAPASSAPASGDSNAPASKDEWWKKIPWWWAAIAIGGYVLLTGDDQSEVKTGLDGVPASAKKKSARKSISI